MFRKLVHLLLIFVLPGVVALTISPIHEAKAQSASGVIEYFSVEYDVYQGMDMDIEIGMQINLQGRLFNLRGTTVWVAVYFYYSDGTPIEDVDGYYVSSSGNVGVFDKIRVTRSTQPFSNQLFIPYDQLELPPDSTWDLKLMVGIFVDGAPKFLDTESEFFTIYLA